MTKKRKLKANPEHDRLCSYWAGCNPFTGVDGNCDCGLSETESELEVYVVFPESVESVSVRKDRTPSKQRDNKR